MRICSSHSTSPKLNSLSLDQHPTRSSLLLILVGITPSIHGISLRIIHDTYLLPRCYIQSVIKSRSLLPLNSSQINLIFPLIAGLVQSLPALKRSVKSLLSSIPLEMRTGTGHCCLSLHLAYQAQCPARGWHSGNVC